MVVSLINILIFFSLKFRKFSFVFLILYLSFIGTHALNSHTKLSSRSNICIILYLQI